MLEFLKMINYKKLNPPCNSCIVRAACTKFCKDSLQYYEKKLIYLSKIDRYLFPLCILISIILLLTSYIYTLIYGKNHELIPVVSHSIIVLVMVGGAYIDIYYLSILVEKNIKKLREIYNEDFS